jgi:hypothetical protein
VILAFYFWRLFLFIYSMKLIYMALYVFKAFLIMSFFRLNPISKLNQFVNCNIKIQIKLEFSF